MIRFILLIIAFSGSTAIRAGETLIKLNRDSIIYLPNNGPLIQKKAQLVQVTEDDQTNYLLRYWASNEQREEIAISLELGQKIALAVNAHARRRDVFGFVESGIEYRGSPEQFIFFASPTAEDSSVLAISGATLILSSEVTRRVENAYVKDRWGTRITNTLQSVDGEVAVYLEDIQRTTDFDPNVSLKQQKFTLDIKTLGTFNIYVFGTNGKRCFITLTDPRKVKGHLDVFSVPRSFIRNSNWSDAIKERKSRSTDAIRNAQKYLARWYLGEVLVPNYVGPEAYFRATATMKYFGGTLYDKLPGVIASLQENSLPVLLFRADNTFVVGQKAEIRKIVKTSSYRLSLTNPTNHSDETNLQTWDVPQRYTASLDTIFAMQRSGKLSVDIERDQYANGTFRAVAVLLNAENEVVGMELGLQMQVLSDRHSSRTKSYLDWYNLSHHALSKSFHTEPFGDAADQTLGLLVPPYKPYPIYVWAANSNIAVVSQWFPLPTVLGSSSSGRRENLLIVPTSAVIRMPKISNHRSIPTPQPNLDVALKPLVVDQFGHGSHHQNRFENVDDGVSWLKMRSAELLQMKHCGVSFL